MAQQIKWTLSILLLGIAIFLSIYFLLPLTESAGNGENKIIVILKTNDYRVEFWQTVSAGVESATKEFDANVEIRGPLTETDVSQQIELVNQAILENPQAIILAPTNYDLLVPAAMKAIQKGIKLVIIDSPLNMEATHHFIATDNVEAGKKAAQILAVATNNKSKMIIIHHKIDANTETEREQGISQALHAYPNMTSLGTYYSEGLEERAYEMTKELLDKYVDINGVIGLNEQATLGAAKAIKEKNKVGQVKLIGFDASIYEIKLLEEGVLDATIVQKPFNMGYLGVKTAIQLIKQEHTEPRLDIASIIVTKDNMYSHENQQLLFPFVEK
jgi:ribose transport system substrate-binding protein